MSFLRQSTASQSRAIGPFLDDTDFKTAETALTIANTDIKCVVNGGASANKNSGGGTHRVNGVYGITFDATDTATVGEIEVSVVVSGALPVFHKFTVLEEAVYDALFAASAPGYLQPTTAGRTLDVSSGGEAGVDWANVGSPTSTLALTNTTIYDNIAHPQVSTTIATLTSQVNFTLTAGSATDDFYNGRVILIVNASVNTVRAFAVVDDYVGSTKQILLKYNPGVFTMAVGDSVVII
jgi:hypothetical protein